MTHHHGWLMIGEQNGNYQELFNHARTAAYLQSSAPLGCRKIYGVLEDGGCPGYAWVPPTADLRHILVDDEGDALTDDENSMLFTGGSEVAPNGWYRATFTNPAADGAPWYNPSYPESAEALGFWVTEWTGLDSGHVRREVSPLGQGGGQFGRTYSAHREMGFEVILLAESEAGMDYLFRWLDATVSSVCSTCSTDSILIRRICPDVDVDPDNAAYGAVELRKVGILEGLTWGTPPIEREGCFMRRANFTLAAMDPCMYTPCTDVPVSDAMGWDACFDVSNVNTIRATCRPSCSEMPGECRTAYNYTIDTPGASGPVVTLSTDLAWASGPATIPVRIRTYANPNGLPPDQLCGAPLLAEVYVTSLPAWSEFRYDMPGRQVLYRDSGTGGWINGFAFLEPNDVGVPRFVGLACGDYTTIVEPASFCYNTSVKPIAGGLNSYVDGVLVSGARVVFGGNFTGFDGNDRAAAVTRGGTAFAAWTGDADGRVRAIVPDGNGFFLLGGDFTSYRGAPVKGIVRVDAEGNVDSSFNTAGLDLGVEGGDSPVGVRAIAVQDDGQIVIAGRFDRARGITQNNIARLNTDGTIDAGFNTGSDPGVDYGFASAQIDDIAIDAAGRIVAVGAFGLVRGVSQDNIARFHDDGTRDTTFTPAASGPVSAVIIQPGGHVVVGGSSASLGGETKNGLARFTTTGVLDPTYNVGASPGVAGGDIWDMAPLPDGGMLVAGSFTTVRGVAQPRLAKLDSVGQVDGTFAPAITGARVAAVDFFADSAIVIGGDFSAVNGEAIDNLAVLTAQGDLDPTFSRLLLVDGDLTIPMIDVLLQERMGCA